MIKTMSVFENMYLVERETPFETKDQVQEYIDLHATDFYQKHQGELVQEYKTWNTREEAIEWLHEEDYW